MDTDISHSHINNRQYSERYKYIDYAKALLILLVVLGHSGFPFTSFIYLFHMAAFFMISGFLYKSDDGNLFYNVIKRIRTLYLPFIMYNFIFLVLYNKFIDLRIYNSSATKYNLGDLFYRVIDIMTFGSYGENLLGAFWYIVVLFEVTIIYALINAISLKSRRREYITLFLVMLIYALGIISLLYGIHLPRNLNTATFVLPLFYLGNTFAKYEDKVPMKRIVFIGSLILLIIMNRIGKINIGQNIYTNQFFYLVSSISGFYMVIYISKVLASKFDMAVVGYIGRNTFVILAYHFLSFKLASVLYIYLNSYDITRLSEFPILSPEEPYGWVLYTIIGLLVPLVLKWIYEKVKIRIARLLTLKE